MIIISWSVLVDRIASGNYFDIEIISQHSQLSPLQGLQSPSLDFTEDTLNDDYVSSEKMLRDVLNYTAAQELNIDILTDRGYLHSKLP